MSKPNKVILDTGAVRTYLHGDEGTDEQVERLIEFRRTHRLSFHLSEVCLAECVLALLEDRIPWDDWKARIAKVAELVDHSHPVVTWSMVLGKNLAYEMATNAAWWRLLTRSTSTGDVESGCEVYDANGRPYKMASNLERARKVHHDNAQKWTDDLNKAKDILTRYEQLKNIQLTEKDAMAFLMKGNPFPVELIERTDAWHKVWIKYAVLFKYDQYKPNNKKGMNDAFDFYSLKFLALPAYLCTLDQTLQNIVRGTGSSQANQVLLPDELLQEFG